MTWSAPIERAVVQIPRAAHGGDFGPERLGNLHRKRTHTTRRTIDQNLLPGLDLSLVAKTLQGGDCRHRDGCRFLEGHDWPVSTPIHFHEHMHTRQNHPGARPEYLITWLKLLHIFANRFNPPRDIRAEYSRFGLRSPVPSRRARKCPLSRGARSAGIYGCRMNFYQYLNIRGSRLFYLFELKNIQRRPVSCAYNRFHGFPPSLL